MEHKRIVDLHIHSTYSDGTDSPEILIDRAKKNKIEVLSITDHNSIEGVRNGLQESKKYGITMIPAIELNVNLMEEIHILAYNIDIENAQLLMYLKKREEKAMEHLWKVYKRIEKDGYKSVVDIKENCTNSARLLICMCDNLILSGFAKTVAEALSHFLYHPKYQLESMKSAPAEEVMDIILSSGGKAVLAHPCKIKAKKEDIIEELKKLGLWGIEIDYGDGGEYFYETAMEYAKKYHLYGTAGSDYHGKARPDTRIGRIVENPYILESIHLLEMESQV